MTIKDLIEILQQENKKSKIVFEYDGIDLEIDEWSIQSTDKIVIIKLEEK